MKTTTGMDRIGRSAAVIAAAVFALSFATDALAQHAGGRPAAAGNMSPMPTLPARPPVTLPERPEAPAASDNAAAATTTVEHTEDGIVRTTTVTNKKGTMTRSTTVSRDEDTGTKTVTSSSTGFDGKTQGVENTVTKTEDGAKHALTKDKDEADTDKPSPPES